MSGPPPEETPFVPIPITQHFLDAASAFTDMYGEFDIRDMSYLVSDEAYSMLLHELDIKDMSAFMDINYPVIGTLYGIALETSEAYSDRQCALIVGSDEYHFEIPEPHKPKRPIAPPPQPTLNMYPGWGKPPKPDPAITPVIKEDNIDVVARFLAEVFIGCCYAFIIMGMIANPGGMDAIGLLVLVGTLHFSLRGQVFRRVSHRLVGFPWIDSQIKYTPIFIDDDGYIHKHKPKRKINGEEMTSLSDLFEGYERIASETKPKRKGKYDLLEAILGDERGCISVSNMSDMYYVRIQSGVNPDGTTKWGKGIPMMSVGYYGNEIVGTPVYIGESPAGLGLSILGERHPGREQMATLGELFEGYEECPQAPEAQPTLVTKC